ncbi:hypothetical protein AVEN_219590-1 [Araneus ventricosus]|uniref:Uncharacterized protein n=1 Tax=Araneus ventricosus TaxID=182803 RepID=A0A4Y2S1U1_ARAVE|nr:hypothetical protein AVEN_219590-1 [Araneus ventricosus]
MSPHVIFSSNEKFTVTGQRFSSSEEVQPAKAVEEVTKGGLLAEFISILPRPDITEGRGPKEKKKEHHIVFSGQAHKHQTQENCDSGNEETFGIANDKKGKMEYQGLTEPFQMVQSTETKKERGLTAGFRVKLHGRGRTKINERRCCEKLFMKLKVLR